MKRIKKIGSIFWGITYVIGTTIATFLILPLVIIITIFNVTR
jgi:hypothetical protein